MFVIHIFQFFLIFLCSFDLIAFRPALDVSAFNIDEEFPIVISNKFDGNNAHFGATVLLLSANATVAQHDKQNDITGWVIIGAPKANSTSAEHQDIFEPGVIWRCSVGNNIRENVSDLHEICTVLEIDPTGEYDPKDIGMPYKDRKDGGWLGGSMFVGNSDRFVACASRWINQKYNYLYLLNGICYWIPKSSLMDPDLRLPPKLSYRLSPLLNRSRQMHRLDRSRGDENKTDPSDWAYGQFGFSLHVTPNNEIIAGAVGVLDWVGSVVHYQDTSIPRAQFARYNAHPGSSVASEVVVVRAQNHSDLLQSSDYFGYSVTSGQFFRQELTGNRTQFAGGAPRASQLSGKVLVFTINEMEHGRSDGTLELLAEPIEGADTSKGNHYGSYFGSSLLALNVNGDDFDDLIVGAPFYGTSLRFKRNAFVPFAPTEKGTGANTTQEGDDATASAKMRSGDEGCVFVYLSDGDDFIRHDVQELCGDKLSGARFGTAITSLGDINSDGFNDIGVGAPYENEGRGAVYIYHGGEHYLQLAQKLEPEMIDTKIKTFGWSLSLGVDIDGNGYPDLAVGAYETNHVVVYRTIPIVHFTTTLTASIPKVLATTNDFNLTSCISYTGKGTPTTLGVWLKLTVEVEPEEKRIISLDPKDEGPKSLEEHSPASLRTIKLSMKKLLYIRNEGSCFNITASCIEGSIDGINRTVVIRQDYWIDGYDRDTETVKPINYEIRKDAGRQLPRVSLTSSKSEFEVFAQSKLPMPTGNMFGTTKLNLSVGTICESDGNPECLANVTITARLTDQSSETPIHYSETKPFPLGKVDILKLEVEISNHREAANLPLTLDLRWSSPPSLRRLPSTSNCRKLGATKNSSREEHYLCFMRKAILESKSDIVSIELDMASVYGELSDRMIEFEMEVNSSTLPVPLPKYKLAVPLKTQMKAQNFNHEISKTEYAGNVSLPTFGITQAFEIGLDGPSSAAALLVHFDIPTTIVFQHELLELIAVKQPIVTYDGDMHCEAINAAFLGDTLPPSSPTVHSKDEVKEMSSKGSPSYVESHESSAKEGKTDNEVMRGKMRRVTRSLVSWLNEQFNSVGNLHRNGIDGVLVEHSEGAILRLNCDSKQVNCLRVSCIAKHFTPKKKASVEFKLKMFNNIAAALLDPQRHDEDITGMWIETVGSVRTLDSKGNSFGDVGKLYFKSQLVIPPPYDVLPAWILIVSVAGGLLLLTICTIILKKCGFFRRSKRDQLRRRMEIEKRLGKKTSAPNRNRSPPSGTHTSSTVRARTPSSLSFRRQNSSIKSAKKTSLQRQRINPNNRGSLMGVECNSPGTIAKQRQIPGAVDLTELRRLYATIDQNELY
ncbi:unnamed protein product [Orchesella dallaii]|uniref:Integrin alpha-2 domain-containing protein n=1 Tax=Orchesella dallaii TaxID=48710 RepID=A0ABP1Q649_9HEXA